jgi:Family of unknown function (DUF5675)
MQIIHTRTDYPSPDVAMGTIAHIPQWFTLQHLPTPFGEYEMWPHVINNGPLKGLACYCLVNPALGVFYDPTHAIGYDGPYQVRTSVLIHPGNWPKDTIGCIIIGSARDTLPNPPNVANSDDTFKQFMAMLGTNVEGHTFVITSV